MTTKQLTEAKAALKELQELKPTVEWRMTWNYYTKLPEFEALKDGGVKYSMFKRERREIVTQANGIRYPRYTGEKYVELSATYDHTTHETSTGMIVSGAHDFDKLPQSNVTEEIARVSFKKYVEFVKKHIGMTEMIGA